VNRGWLKIGLEEDFAADLTVVSAGGEKILICRLAGTLYACSARCPHAGISMKHAEIEGTILTCPLHGWRFDMGEAGAEIHGYRGLATRNVKIEAGAVYVNEQS
jgi:nitrite reductase/ring-hydroxylating ferredoxin subunit